MDKDIKIEIFTKAEVGEISKLLSQAGLPTEDLTLDKLKNFLVARQERVR